MTQNEFNVVLEQQYRKCADLKSLPHYRDAHLRLLWPE